MTQKQSALRPYEKQLLKALARQAPHYKKSAAIIEEIGQRLISRLMYFRVPPEKILDLGCGQGFDSQLLANIYSASEITAVDFCHEQLAHWPTHPNFACCVADVEQLPFPAQYFDLLFANLLMPAIIDYQNFWQECLRVLKPGGILLFSTLGSESLKELKQSLAQFKQADCINVFPNMHDIGDGLAAAGFSDPAIESELIELHYSSLKKLLTELKQLGSIKIWAEYPHLYKNKIFWEQLENYYRQHFSSDQQKLIATAELYYGIAFAPKQRQGIDAEVSIPISMISRKNT